MSETKRRKLHTPEFKAKLGLEALSGVKTIHQIAQENGVHPVQIGLWKKEIREQAQQLFAGKRGPKPVAEHADPEALYSQIGKLKMELDWLKKSLGSACERAAHLDHHGARSGTLLQGGTDGLNCPGQGGRGRAGANTLSALDTNAMRLSRRVSRHRVRAPTCGRCRCQ